LQFFPLFFQSLSLLTAIACSQVIPLSMRSQKRTE
jgi:hypothetical protein